MEAKRAEYYGLAVEQEHKKPHNLLETDCKAASHFLRTAVYRVGTYGAKDCSAVRMDATFQLA
jgi:hypothetical protein